MSYLQIVGVPNRALLGIVGVPIEPYRIPGYTLGTHGTTWAPLGTTWAPSGSSSVLISYTAAAAAVSSGS